MYRHTHVKDVENVLILQGGGSLGAFACGVCKTFAKKYKIWHIIGLTVNWRGGFKHKGSNQYKENKQIPMLCLLI